MSTIQDIAQESGYSIGTVSRVLNNRSGVSDKAREKIEEVIREQDYQPNSNARMLRQTVSSEIAVIVRGSNIFLQSVLEKIQIRLGQLGESANVQFIEETANEVAIAAQAAQNLKPKGLIFLGGNVDSFKKEFSDVNIPSVLLAASADGLGYDKLSSFSTDDKGAAAYVINMLVEQGHRRIGILGGYPEDALGEHPNGTPPTLRIKGAVEELGKHGIEFDIERDFEPCSFSAHGGYQGAKKLLVKAPDLTAVFGISDAVALGAIRAFKDLGLSVPEDISVAGFDGVLYSKYSVPRLATIQQDIDALAKKAVDDLLLRITYDSPAVHEMIPYKFVKGESIARPCK